MELLRARRCRCSGIHSRNDRLPPPYRLGGAAHLPRGSRARATGRGPLAPLSQVTGLPQTPCRHCDLSSNGTSASGSPLCQGRGLAALEGAPLLVAVKVVRPVGRSTLTAPARRRGGLAVEAAWGSSGAGIGVASMVRVRVVACPKSR